MQTGQKTSCIILLFKKMLKTQSIERVQFKTVLTGTLITFLLILTFNLVLPLGFKQLRFIPLGAIFVFPFVLFTAYAIIKHHLLNVKVIATEILTFLLIVITFSEVVISKSILVYSQNFATPPSSFAHSKASASLRAFGCRVSIGKWR